MNIKLNHDDADADGVAGCPDARVPDDATRGIRVSHGWWSREREEETDDDDIPKADNNKRMERSL